MSASAERMRFKSVEGGISQMAIDGPVEPVAAISVRTAIVHDWFQGYHGSERVVEAMRAGLFAPGNDPDVFTFHAARDLLPDELARSIVCESRLSRLPGIRQRGHDPGRWRYLLPYMPRFFEKLPLDDYDLAIASSHACAVHARPRQDATFVCYCHTPMRYAWMPATDRDRVGGLKGVALRRIGRRLRGRDLEASQRPDLFIANSTATQERIKRFYGRDSIVIHPPVDVDEFTPASGDSEHFLWVHRLVKYKRPDLIVEAFRELPYRLTMVGVGPMEAELRKSLPPNVELLSWLPRDELVHLYQQAGGFIHVGEEDFGISMVEALASATPVVALAKGGALDIVRDGVDGVLIERPAVTELRSAVRRVAERNWDDATLVARSQDFSRARFVTRMRAQLNTLTATRRMSLDA